MKEPDAAAGKQLRVVQGPLQELLCRHPLRQFRQVQASLEQGLGGLALTEIAEDQHHAGNSAVRLANGCPAVVDGDLLAVLGDQHRVVSQADHPSLSQDLLHGALDRLAGLFVDDPEDRLQGLPDGIAAGPAGQTLGLAIEEGNATLQIRADHRIADAGEGNGKKFLLTGGLGGGTEHLLLRAFAFRGFGLALPGSVEQTRHPAR